MYVKKNVFLNLTVPCGLLYYKLKCNNIMYMQFCIKKSTLFSSNRWKKNVHVKRFLNFFYTSRSSFVVFKFLKKTRSTLYHT